MLPTTSAVAIVSPSPATLPARVVVVSIARPFAVVCGHHEHEAARRRRPRAERPRGPAGRPRARARPRGSTLRMWAASGACRRGACGRDGATRIFTSIATTPAADATTGFRSISAISGTAVGERADAQDQVLERVHVDRRAAAVAEQQLRAAQRTHELVRVFVGHGDEAQRPVGQQLGGHAAEPEQHERSERRVLGDADDELDARADHRLHDRARHRRARATRDMCS